MLKPDGETLVLHTDERDKWMQKDPYTFYITDHYKNYSYMLVRLSAVDPVELVNLLHSAIRKRANKTTLKAYDQLKVD